MFFKNFPFVSKKDSLRKTTDRHNYFSFVITLKKSLLFNKLKRVKIKYKTIRILVNIENSSFNLSI